MGFGVALYVNLYSYSIIKTESPKILIRLIRLVVPLSLMVPLFILIERFMLITSAVAIKNIIMLCSYIISDELIRWIYSKIKEKKEENNHEINY